MQSLDFPFRFDRHNRTAMAEADAQVRDLVYQLLFTTPGERVMRPDFGSGLLQLTFEPNSDELAATTRMLIVGALQEHLGDRIVTDDVAVDNRDGALRVTVQYTVIATQERATAAFNGEAP